MVKISDFKVNKNSISNLVIYNKDFTFPGDYKSRSSLFYYMYSSILVGDLI
jgi:hypothetical protein